MSIAMVRRACCPCCCSWPRRTASAQVTGRNFDHLTTGYELTGAHRLQACEIVPRGRRVRGHAARVRRVPFAGLAHRRDAQAVDSRRFARTCATPATRRRPGCLRADSTTTGGPRQLRDLPQRRAGAGQARRPRRDQPGLRRAATARPPGARRGSTTPASPATAPPATTASRRPARVRRTSRRRNSCESCHTIGAWVAAHPHRPHAGQRQLRVVPRRQVARRAQRNPHTDARRPATPATRPSAWKPASFDHDGIVDRCVACHDGTGRPASAPATSRPRPPAHACHSTVAWKPTTQVDHGNVLGSCSTCHDGLAAKGQAANHIPTSAECDNCHATTRLEARQVRPHRASPTTALSCHDGTRATGRTRRTSSRPTTCESCHVIAAWKPASRSTTRRCSAPASPATTARPPRARTPRTSRPTTPATAATATTAWKPANFSHTRPDAKPASAATTASGRPARASTHIMASDRPAAACHATFRWRPVTKVDHTQVSGSCSSCHNGTTATGKNAAHIGYQQQPATPATRPQPGSRPRGSTTPGDRHLLLLPRRHDRSRQARHPHPSDNACGNCHVTTAWKPARSTTRHHDSCASCHDGTRATGKTPTHICEQRHCESCHATTAWKPATRVDHTQVTGTCSTCHDGTTATGKNAEPHPDSRRVRHLPLPRARGSRPASPTPASPTRLRQLPRRRQGDRQERHAHPATSDTCEACHSTTGWRPATRVDHTQVTGSCSSLPQRHDRDGQVRRAHIAVDERPARTATPRWPGSRPRAWTTRR